MDKHELLSQTILCPGREWVTTLSNQFRQMVILASFSGPLTRGHDQPLPSGRLIDETANRVVSPINAFRKGQKRRSRRSTAFATEALAKRRFVTNGNVPIHYLRAGGIKL